ncbi:hypothetical protein ACSDR0_00520 [Streptosporangium sp. G11]|uniref:hypothetical protein n=1 Tax=Streptosporangium sp. G11 TaxID=3436926 RepID=UPI003EBDF11A
MIKDKAKITFKSKGKDVVRGKEVGDLVGESADGVAVAVAIKGESAGEIVFEYADEVKGRVEVDYQTSSAIEGRGMREAEGLLLGAIEDERKKMSGGTGAGEGSDEANGVDLGASRGGIKKRKVINAVHQVNGTGVVTDKGEFKGTVTGANKVKGHTVGADVRRSVPHMSPSANLRRSPGSPFTLV